MWRPAWLMPICIPGQYYFNAEAKVKCRKTAPVEKIDLFFTFWLLILIIRQPWTDWFNLGRVCCMVVCLTGRKITTYENSGNIVQFLSILFRVFW